MLILKDNKGQEFQLTEPKLIDKETIQYKAVHIDTWYLIALMNFKLDNQ